MSAMINELHFDPFIATRQMWWDRNPTIRLVVKALLFHHKQFNVRPFSVPIHIIITDDVSTYGNLICCLLGQAKSQKGHSCSDAVCRPLKSLIKLIRSQVI